MTTKTVQFQFKIGTVLTDVTSVVLRDVTNTFGIRRTDTLAIVTASGTALTRLSVGLYSYTFTEPAANLNYEYWIEYVYAGNTKRIRQVLETGIGGGSVAIAPSVYAQMGVDTVACGDATLSAFLTLQANLVWAMQARRGVALDLQYQYYVSDLIVIAMDHVRMLIDTEIGASDMHDHAAMDATSNSTANASTSKTRTSSFTESSSSAQNWSRSASRSSSASSRLQSSNSASRSASQSDYSTMSQSASGSSSRTQTGSSTSMGSLATDGTSGTAASDSTASTISRTLYEGGYLTGSGMPPGLVSQYTSSNAFVSILTGPSGGISWATGNGAIFHQVTPSVLGRINASGAYDPQGAPGDYSLKNTSTVEHGRTLVGSQTGSGSSTFTSSGSRVNNRTGSSTASANSSISGTSSSTMTSASHEQQARTASSVSHSDSSYHSTMTATSTAHRESLGTDTMTASASGDREYYSQIFDSLKQMWQETQEAIRNLESKMLLTTRYLVDKLTVVTSQAKLVSAASLPTLPTLTQRPGVAGNRMLTRPFDRWIIR